MAGDLPSGGLLAVGSPSDTIAPMKRDPRHSYARKWRARAMEPTNPGLMMSDQWVNNGHQQAVIYQP